MINVQILRYRQWLGMDLLQQVYNISEYVPFDLTTDIELIYEEEPFGGMIKTSFIELPLINTNKYVSHEIFKKNQNDYFEIILTGDRFGKFHGYVDLQESNFDTELAVMYIHHISHRLYKRAENLNTIRVFESAQQFESGWFDNGASWERFQKIGWLLKNLLGRSFNNFYTDIDEVSGLDIYINNRLYNVTLAANCTVMELIHFFSKIFNCRVFTDDDRNIHFMSKLPMFDVPHIPDTDIIDYKWKIRKGIKFIYTDIVIRDTRTNKMHVLPVYERYYPSTNNWQRFYVWEDVQRAGLTRDDLWIIGGMETTQPTDDILNLQTGTLLPGSVPAESLFQIYRMFCYKDGTLTKQGTTGSHFKPISSFKLREQLTPLFFDTMEAEINLIHNPQLLSSVQINGKLLTITKINYDVFNNVTTAYATEKNRSGYGIIKEEIVI